MHDPKQSNLTRREFLRTTTCGAALTGVGVGAFRALAAPAASQPATQPALPAGILGRTQYPVTRVSFGAIALSENLHVRLLRMAIDYGINLVHTAKGYTGGNSMRIVGQVFQENPRLRDRAWLAYKIDGKSIEEELNDGLAAMKTDNVDLLLPTLHEADPQRLETIITVQEKLRKEGKIRHVGFVCHKNYNEVIPLVLQKAPDFFEAALIATAWAMGVSNKLRGQGDERASKQFVENLRALRKSNVGILSMKSGAQQAVSQGPDVFGPHVKNLIQKASVDTVLTTLKTREQLETVRRLDLKDLQPTPAEQEKAQAFNRSRSEACRLCGACNKACPQALPVSDLMRVRLYHDEYGEPELAKAEFQALGLNPESLLRSCGPCADCTAVCPAGLAGARTIRQIAMKFV